MMADGTTQLRISSHFRKNIAVNMPEVFLFRCCIFLLFLASHEALSESRIRGNRTVQMRLLEASLCEGNICPSGDGYLMHVQGPHKCREECKPANRVEFRLDSDWKCGSCPIGSSVAPIAHPCAENICPSGDGYLMHVHGPHKCREECKPANRVEFRLDSDWKCGSCPIGSSAAPDAHPCEEHICPGGDGYMMHFLGKHNCHEDCKPSNKVDFRLGLDWKCGSCPTVPPAPITLISHQGSTSVWNAKGRNMTISRPSQSAPGDMLFLFLSRTDDYLPLHLEGWTTASACLKTENRQDNCHLVEDCTNWHGDYCLEFGDPSQRGLDLSTAVFYRTVESDEQLQYTLNLWCGPSNKCNAAWAILTALRGADNQNPIGDSATRSKDKLRRSRFPSVSDGEPGDKLLLSMALDDGRETGVRESFFRAPDGATRLSYVIGTDEAGFLFAEDIQTTGATGQRTTNGPGVEYKAKDALISLLVKKQPSE